MTWKVIHKNGTKQHFLCKCFQLIFNQLQLEYIVLLATCYCRYNFARLVSHRFIRTLFVFRLLLNCFDICCLLPLFLSCDMNKNVILRKFLNQHCYCTHQLSNGTTRILHLFWISVVANEYSGSTIVNYDQIHSHKFLHDKKVNQFDEFPTCFDCWR